MPATQALFLSNGKDQWTVHAKRRDGDPPRGSQPGDADALPAEVVCPALPTRMKQWGGSARRRIDTRPSGFFPQGTRHTGQRKIVGARWAASASGNDVVDVKRGLLALVR